MDPWNGETGETGSGIIYYGYATAGTLNSEPKWSIKKRVIIDNVLTYQYPYETSGYLSESSPSIAIDNGTILKLSGLIWDNRTGYTYK